MQATRSPRRARVGASTRQTVVFPAPPFCDASVMMLAMFPTFPQRSGEGSPGLSAICKRWLLDTLDSVDIYRCQHAQGSRPRESLPRSRLEAGSQGIDMHFAMTNLGGGNRSPDLPTAST